MTMAAPMDEREHVLFLHGSLGGANDAFAAQMELAARYRITVPVRRGYDLLAPASLAVDHAVDADETAALLGEGAHLVGTSTGGVIAMMVAARHAGRVCSLTLIEPTAFPVAAGDPDVDALREALRLHWERHVRTADDRAFMEGFLKAQKMTRPVPDAISPELSRAMAMLRTERPWSFAIPVEQVAAAGIPVLLVSGGWSNAYEAVCRRLRDLLPGRLETISGHGHAVQKAGLAFNKILIRHIDRAAKHSSNMETEDASIG